MKKFGLVLMLAFGLVLATTSFASAKDLTQRFGIGADSTLGWGTQLSNAEGGPSAIDGKGLALTYYVSKMFGLQVIAAADFTSASTDPDTDLSATMFGFAVRGIIPVAFTNDVNLNAVVGFSFASLGSETTAGGTTVDGSASYLSFDLGIRPEWFITDHFSIHTQVGVALSLLNEDNTGYTDGGMDINIFANPDLVGQAGFTFYMN